MDGNFLSVDDRFCALIRRHRDDIIGRTILELTGAAYRPVNAGKLDNLRAFGEAFVIRKTYLCGDGSQQAVESSVSIVDGVGGRMFAASVRVLRDDPGLLLQSAVEAACSLLAERRRRLVLDTTLKENDWPILLAAFVAEARGEPNWAKDLSELAGGDAAYNLLRMWELVKDGVLVMDGKPISLERASIRIAHHHAKLVEQHLQQLSMPSPQDAE